MDVLWFIPTYGDSRYLGTDIGKRATDYGYLRQLAGAIDTLGYKGALLPTSHNCEDAWLVASFLAPVTEKMQFLVALRPGLMSPTLSARMASTFDRLSNGRLLINVVTGGDPVEAAGDGVHLDHDGRYRITNEFLSVWRDLMQGEKVTYQGDHIDIRDGQLFLPPVQKPYPPLYFGGSSQIGMEIAARQADVYLTWGEPPALVGEKVEKVRKLAAAAGRTVRFGIRLHVVVRETDSEAWAEADNLLHYVDQKKLDEYAAYHARFDSVGEQRQRGLRAANSRESLEISPNLWAGVGLVRSGAGTALVGDPQTVAERMKEYAAVGIDTFIMSGQPHLEEAYRFAELVFPHLPL